MKPADRLALCRKYFFFGIAGLPFLWLVNTLWFGNFVFIQKGEPKAKRNGNNGSNNGSQRNGQTQQQQQQGGSSRFNPNQPSTSAGGSGSSTPRNRGQAGTTSPQAPAPQEDPELVAEKLRSLNGIRRYVILSAVGTLIWAIIIITWVTIFQVKRAEWGEWGDSISFNIPRGIP